MVFLLVIVVFGIAVITLTVDVYPVIIMLLHYGHEVMPDRRAATHPVLAFVFTPGTTYLLASSPAKSCVSGYG
jgi:hypothetical protein